MKTVGKTSNCESVESESVESGEWSVGQGERNALNFTTVHLFPDSSLLKY